MEEPRSGRRRELRSEKGGGVVAVERGVVFFTPCREVSGDEGSRHTSRTRGRTMSSSSYFFTFLNALPIIMVATKKTSKPWEPSPYYFADQRSLRTALPLQPGLSSVLHVGALL